GEEVLDRAARVLVDGADRVVRRAALLGDAMHQLLIPQAKAERLGDPPTELGAARAGLARDGDHRRRRDGDARALLRAPLLLDAPALHLLLDDLVHAARAGCHDGSSWIARTTSATSRATSASKSGPRTIGSPPRIFALTAESVSRSATSPRL